MADSSHFQSQQMLHVYPLPQKLLKVLKRVLAHKVSERQFDSLISSEKSFVGKKALEDETDSRTKLILMQCRRGSFTSKATESAKL